MKIYKSRILKLIPDNEDDNSSGLRTGGWENEVVESSPSMVVLEQIDKTAQRQVVTLIIIISFLINSFIYISFHTTWHLNPLLNDIHYYHHHYHWYYN